MRRLKTLTAAGVLAAAVTFATSASAIILQVQVSPIELPGLVQAVDLQVIDEVSDGCWTDARETQQMMQGILTNANINVEDVDQAENAMHPTMILSASGQRINDSYCIVQTELRVSFVSLSQFSGANTNGDVLIMSTNTISNLFRANVAMVSDENVNSEIIQWAEDATNAFAQEVETKRRMNGVRTLREALGILEE